jgi:DNA (cytosine-5)-methyltransferase 1
MTLTFGSLFAGVGGFDMGFEQAGWDCKFQVEWDKNCQQILNKHWPDVPKWLDVSDVNGAEIPPVDCIIFGSPCQDLSVAGARRGLSGERSGLFHEAVRIIKEMRDATNGTFPKWTVWENVAGALSSNNGRDFGTVINEMAKAGAHLQEYALLDAQYFGVPQRRRRVFLVSCFDPTTADRCPDPLLPVSESLRGDSKKGKSKRKELASQVAESFGSDGQWAAGSTEGGDILRTSVTSKWYKGSAGPSGSEYYNMVVEDQPILIDRAAFNQGENAAYEPYISDEPVIPSLVARGPHAVFTKSRRAQTSTDDETWVAGEVNPTLNSFDVGDTRATTAIVEPVLFENSYRDGARIAKDGVTQTLSAKMGTGGGNTPMIAVPTYSFDTQFGSNANVTENVSPTLKASQQSPSIAYPIQDGRDMEKHQNGFGVASDGEPSYTLDQTGAQAVAYSVREDAKANTFSATELDHANALSALRPSPQSHHAQMFIAEQVSFYDGYNQKLDDSGIHRSLRIGRDSSDFVAQPAEPMMAVRRLTPLECERLMGWPDDHTKYKADGTEQADTHRYKQCGNGVATPVAKWVAEHIGRVEYAEG